MKRSLFLGMIALLVALSPALAQNSGANATLDLDTQTGDQAQTALTNAFQANDILNVEIRGTGTTGVIAFEVEFSFDTQFFEFDSGATTLTGSGGEPNLLTVNGGSIFGSFITNSSVSGTIETITFAVTLNGASQNATNAAAGAGLLGNIAFKVKSALTPGTNASITLKEVEYIHHTLASDVIAVNTAASVTANGPPTAASITSPASGNSVTVTGNPSDAFVINWSGSTDPDGDSVTYTWEFAADAGFSNVLMTQSTGTATSVSLTMGALATLMTNQGIPLGGGSTFFHRVTASDGITTAVVGGAATVTLVRGTIVPNEGERELPTAFILDGNYPNPFNPTTNIRFDLPEAATVTVRVFDMLGREMMVVPTQAFGAGAGHVLRLEAGHLQSGLYLYRVTAEMTSGRVIQTGRMTLLK